MPARTRLKVLHAAPFLWSGAGHVITRLVESQHGPHTVALVTSPRSATLSNWPLYDRRVANLGIRHDRIDLFHRDSPSFWTAVTEMTRTIEAFGPDIVHAHAGTPTAVALLARAASSRPSVPLVAHFYSWGLGRPAWMDQMDLWAFARADVTVCSARAYREILLAGGVGRTRLQLLPWGLPANVAPRQAPPRSSRAPILGTLGRVEPRKGQLDIVRAFARLRSRWPEARLEIIGPVANEAYAAEVRGAISRLGLDTAVRLTGHVAHPLSRVARWSVYLSLSEDEGQGLAVLEAMSCGVPVVALGVPGIEDYLIDGRTGLLAPRRSAAAVARVVERLLASPALASTLSARAQTMVRRRYSWDGTTARIESIYRRLLLP